MSMRKALVVACAAAIVAAIAVVQLRQAGIIGSGGALRDADVGTGTATVGGPFALVDAQGRNVTDADFRGRVMLVYFGYTHCPDVCPTDLAAIGEAVRTLGPAADSLAPIFITLDPQRDTPAVMGDFVQLVDPKVIGLSGSPAATDAAAKAYRVYYTKVPQPGFPDGYGIDHSAYMYLMGRDGKFLTVFRHGTEPDAIAAGIKPYL
jgi:protein SCO1/2